MKTADFEREVGGYLLALTQSTPGTPEHVQIAGAIFELATLYALEAALATPQPVLRTTSLPEHRA